MKKCTRIISCFLIVACMTSFFCVPAFAATGDLSDGYMEQISPFAYPERQKTENFQYAFYDAETKQFLLEADITATGIWSQVENSAYMTGATCDLSGPYASVCADVVGISGTDAVIAIFKNGALWLRITLTIHTNGNISAKLQQFGNYKVGVSAN